MTPDRKAVIHAQEVREVPARAPIAAKLEDCLQAITRLRAVLNAELWLLNEKFREVNKPQYQKPVLGEEDGSFVEGGREAEKAEADDTSLRGLERCFARLVTWGYEVGATSRFLDHSLRRSAKLQSGTLALLRELHELILTDMLAGTLGSMKIARLGELTESKPQRPIHYQQPSTPMASGRTKTRKNNCPRKLRSWTKVSGFKKPKKSETSSAWRTKMQ
ncbi:hypothetical protein OQA88_5074 [Cercophora sp. LCS_1]